MGYLVGPTRLASAEPPRFQETSARARALAIRTEKMAWVEMWPFFPTGWVLHRHASFRTALLRATVKPIATQHLLSLSSTGLVDVGDGASLEWCPAETLVEAGDRSATPQSENPLHASLLAFVMLGLRSPGEENGHIFRHLAHSGFGPIGVRHLPVLQRWRHSDGRSAEVGVVVQA